MTAARKANQSQSSTSSAHAVASFFDSPSSNTSLMHSARSCAKSLSVASRFAAKLMSLSSSFSVMVLCLSTYACTHSMLPAITMPCLVPIHVVGVISHRHDELGLEHVDPTFAEIRTTEGTTECR